MGRLQELRSLVRAGFVRRVSCCTLRTQRSHVCVTLDCRPPSSLSPGPLETKGSGRSGWTDFGMGVCRKSVVKLRQGRAVVRRLREQREGARLYRAVRHGARPAADQRTPLGIQPATRHVLVFVALLASKERHARVRSNVCNFMTAIARRGIGVYSLVHWDSGQQVLKAATAGRRMRTESDSGCEKSKVMYTGLLAFTIQVRCASLGAACSRPARLRLEPACP